MQTQKKPMGCMQIGCLSLVALMLIGSLASLFEGSDDEPYTAASSSLSAEAKARQDADGRQRADSIIANIPAKSISRIDATELAALRVAVTQYADPADSAAAAWKAEAERVENARRKDEEKKAAARRRTALAKLRKNTDEVKGITWYYDRSSPEYLNSRSNLFLYMGHRENSAPALRFKIQYVADDWLFIETYTIKADDQTFTISPGHFGAERDNGGGEIWEWYDVAADAREIEIARAIADAKKTIIRHEGKQYRKDRTVSDREKQAIRNVLDAYDALRTAPAAS